MNDGSEGESERRLSVIMFSDIVGYSKMMQASEDHAMDLLGRHNAIIRESLSKHNGHEVKVIGDAFLVSFSTVTNAVKCAIEIQENFSKYNDGKDESEKILVRIGIHLGDIIVKEKDVFGDGVNIASRIEPLAEPGGICISQEIYNLMKHKLDVEVVSLGPKELKNIKDKIEIYEILVGSIAGQELAASGRRIMARSNPIHKRLSTWIVSGIVFIGLAFGVYVFKLMSPEPSSRMVPRVLRAVNYSVEDPNISPDGNWVVYAAYTTLWNYNLYIQSVSGGTPKRITNDSSSVLTHNPCFSPDASEVLYVQEAWHFDSTTSSLSNFPNIYKVSVLGGTPRKIITNGDSPEWSLDGRTIAFERPREDTTTIAFQRSSLGKDSSSIWIANTDGSSQRLIARQAHSPAWSPDSKRLAYERDFINDTKEKYSEIFFQDLSTGKVQQLTYQKKKIGDYCWAATDELVFSLSDGANTNLWAMAIGGSVPKQLTFELGRNLAPQISKDGKRLVYMNRSFTTNIWTANLATNQLRQLTFEDASLVDPTFSPQGDKILHKRSVSSHMELFLCNVDGSEPVQIGHLKATLGRSPGNAQLSGDEKGLAYCAEQSVTDPTKPDSIYWTWDIFTQDLEKDTAQIVGKGYLVDWSADRKYMLLIPNYPRAYGSRPQFSLALTNVLDKPIRQFESHTSPSFTHDGKNVLYTDSTKLWSMAIESGRRSLLFTLPKESWWVRETPDGKSIGIGTRPPHLKGVWASFIISKSGKGIEKIGEVNSQEVEFWGASFSSDMKTLLLTKPEARNRVVIIDNFR